MKAAVDVSKAREDRRLQIVAAASALVDSQVDRTFDPVHSPLCAIDVIIIAGAPWLKDGLERDFLKDDSGYRKLGGGSNSPNMVYFFRRSANLIHHLKRQGFYIPIGSKHRPAAGMAFFLDFENRGRFNFAPDRSGIVTAVDNNRISEVVMPIADEGGFTVKRLSVTPGDKLDLAIIGYSDLP